MLNDGFAFRVVDHHLLLMLHSIMVLLSSSKEFPTFKSGKSKKNLEGLAGLDAI